MSLLPANRTPFEAALDATLCASFDGLDPALVAAVWDADRCPVHMLGYLANGLSVDIWSEDWPELRKRDVCRRAIDLHRAKGSLAGIAAHVALTGAELVRAIRPPARGYLRGAMTDAQRAAWLESLPQIRLYPFVHVAIDRRRTFYRAASRVAAVGTLDSAGWTFDSNELRFDSEAATIALVDPAPATRSRLTFHGQGYLQPSVAIERRGTRATLWDRGQEREIRLDGTPSGSAVLRLLIPRTTRRGWHGRGHYDDHLASSHAARGIVTLNLAGDIGGFAVEAGLNPVDIRPVRVAEPRTAPAARSYFGRFAKGRFLATSYAPNLVYDRVSLLDPSRLGARRTTRSFHGVGRFGMAPYTAELRIRVPLHRGRRRSGRWHGVGYRDAPDLTPLTRAVEAVTVSKAFRDTIHIDTALHERARFGRGLRFGDFTFGDIREAA